MTALKMKLPPTMQPENTPLLTVSQSTENEKGKKSSYVGYAMVFCFISIIVGIVLMIISKLNEQNQDNNVHLMIARDETAMKDAEKAVQKAIIGGDAVKAKELLRKRFIYKYFNNLQQYVHKLYKLRGLIYFNYKYINL
jgi:hypothetical protein